MNAKSLNASLANANNPRNKSFVTSRSFVCKRNLATNHCRKFTVRSPARSAKASASAGPSGWNAESYGPKHIPLHRSTQLSVALTGSIAALAALGGNNGGLTGGSGGDGGGGGGGGGGGSSGSGPLYELAMANAKEDSEEEVEDEEEDASGSEAEEDDDPDSEDASGDEDAEEESDEDDDRELMMRQRMGTPKSSNQLVDEVVLIGFPEGEGVPTKEELLAPLVCQPGFVCTRKDISADLRSFMNYGVFHDVQARIATGKDGKARLVFTFIEQDMPAPKSMDVKPYKGTQKLALPNSVINKARNALLNEGGPLNAKKLFKLRNTIDTWYQKRGYSNSLVAVIEGQETGNLKVKVLEGKVNNVNIVQVDADGKPTGKPGHVLPHVILREVPFRVSSFL